MPKPSPLGSNKPMKEAVKRALQDALSTANSQIDWMKRARKRLVQENGDPLAIEKFDKWIAREIEDIVELRGALKP